MNYQCNMQFDESELQKYIDTELNQAAPGDGDFLAIGKHFVSLFVEKCNLGKKSKVLDVGCSTGRNAIPMIQVIKNGKYEGFDPIKPSIEWCQSHIQSKNKNFNFQFIDTYNAPYNPNGTVDPTKFVFPYSESYFDLVFLVSVFTHMVPNEVENYLKQISRVLKPGGFAFITYFLLDDITKPLMGAGRADRSFSQGGDPVAYEKTWVENEYSKNKLQINEVLHGWWSGYDKPTSYQDIIIAQKI